jgi:hypothetical protein
LAADFWAVRYVARVVASVFGDHVGISVSVAQSYFRNLRSDLRRTRGVKTLFSQWSDVVQKTLIGDRLAIACLRLCHNDLPSMKIDIGSAFRKAWIGWPNSSLLPQVHVTLARNDIYIQTTLKSPGREGRVAHWEIGKRLRPVIDGGWSIEDASEHIVDVV